MNSRLLLVVLVFCALVACAAPPPRTPNPNATPAPTSAPLINISIGASATPSRTATPIVTPSPTPTQGPVFTEYRVRPGDTLGGISQRFNVTVEELMLANGLDNPNSLQVDQVVRIPTQVDLVAPDLKLVPDSEVVYGPAYKDFDIQAVADKHGGYLASYTELTPWPDYTNRTGAEILQLVAERFSVGPRVLLTLLELNGGWVTSSVLRGDQIAFPMGKRDGAQQTLYQQASWAANQLNAGYYGKLSGRLGYLQFPDRQRARFAQGINPGTAAIQNMLAQNEDMETWETLVGEQGFAATYRKLFGDPFQYEVSPLIPPDLKQPTLRLPLEDGKQWYLTGGPHAGWQDGSPWAAVDFAPADMAGSCWVSQYWIVAAAPGEIIQAERGRVAQDLDGDGFHGTGWTLIYMHMGDEERAEIGKLLKTNDPVGHPSCEGGYAETSHIHFARLYNGQWIAADDPKLPMTLSGWVFSGDGQEYDGVMTRGNERRTAENQRLEGANDVIADGGK